MNPRLGPFSWIAEARARRTVITMQHLIELNWSNDGVARLKVDCIPMQRPTRLSDFAWLDWTILSEMNASGWRSWSERHWTRRREPLQQFGPIRNNHLNSIKSSWINQVVALAHFLSILSFFFFFFFFFFSSSYFNFLLNWFLDTMAWSNCNDLPRPAPQLQVIKNDYIRVGVEWNMNG